MRIWTVEGADERSGENRKVNVSAQDENDAIAWARSQGILTSRVYVSRQMLVTANTKEVRKEEDLKGESKEVSKAARRLRDASAVLAIFGWIYVILSIVLGFICILVLTNRSSFSAGTFGVTGLIYMVIGFATGVLFLGAGAALRMLAAIGVAVTEISKKLDNRS